MRQQDRQVTRQTTQARQQDRRVAAVEVYKFFEIAIEAMHKFPDAKILTSIDKEGVSIKIEERDLFLDLTSAPFPDAWTSAVRPADMRPFSCNKGIHALSAKEMKARTQQANALCDSACSWVSLLRKAAMPSSEVQ